MLAPEEVAKNVWCLQPRWFTMRCPKAWCYDSVLAAKPSGSLQLWGNPPGAGVRMSNAVADTMCLQWAAMPWEFAEDRCLHRQGSLMNMCRGAIQLCQAMFLVASMFLCVLIMRSAAGDPNVIHVATPNSDCVTGVILLQLNHWNYMSEVLPTYVGKLRSKVFLDVRITNQPPLGKSLVSWSLTELQLNDVLLMEKKTTIV